MSLFLPRGFQKPVLGARLHPTHPASFNIGACYVLHEGAGRPVNLAGHPTTQHATYGTAGTWTGGGYETAGSAGGTDHLFRTRGFTPSSALERTMIVGFYPTVSRLDGVYFGMYCDDSDTPSARIGIKSGGAGDVYVYDYAGAVVENLLYAVTDLTPNVLAVAAQVSSFDGTTYRLKGYRDGREATAQTAGGAWFTGFTDASFAVGNVGCRFAFAYFWPYAVDAEIVKALTVEPYAFLTR